MTNNEIIEKLIKNQFENELLDFKAKQYSDKESLIKDVLAMANCHSSEAKYIIFGIKVSPTNEKNIIGIEENEFKDSAEYQQLIHENIEPDLHIEYFPFKYENKLLGILKIAKSENKPYILKKDLGKSRKGLCYIRKGSHQTVATRADYDKFYSLKEEIGVALKSPFLFATDNNGLAKSQVLFKNHSNNPITITGGCLELSSSSGEKLTSHQLYGFDRKYVGSDFALELKHKSELLGDAMFGFTSTDCLRLKMDSSGFVDGLTAKITIWDSSEREYTNSLDNFCIIVKGNVLWKVELKEEEKETHKKWGFFR